VGASQQYCQRSTTVLGDVNNIYHNEGSYTPSCVLPTKYRPCIIRGRPLAEQTPASNFPTKRKAGDHNIDLWYDGTLYPLNPQMGAAPPFQDSKSFLCYLGDGENGLLGYAKSLSGGNHWAEWCAQLHKLLELLDAQRRTMHADFLAEWNALLASSVHDRCLYEKHASELRARFHEAQLAQETQIQKLRADISAHIAEKVHTQEETNLEIQSLMVRCSDEVHRLHKAYESKIQDMKFELLRTTNDLSRLVMKCDRLSKSCFSRVTNRHRKDLIDLARRGGRTKLVKAMVRCSISFLFGFLESASLLHYLCINCIV
jgi:hypothetical protein